MAAAAAGDSSAQSNLGSLYMTGLPGVLQPDPHAAIEWFKKSAAQGDETGRRNLETALAVAR